MNGFGSRLALTGIAAAIGLASSLAPTLAQDTIRIGNIVATAGPLKSAAEPTVVAVDIAVEEINANGGINGKPIEIVRFDTGSDPKQASVGARKLNDAERFKTLMLPTSSSAPGLAEGKTYLYRLSEDEAVQFGRLLDTIKKAGFKAETAEIVYISDDVVSNIAGTKLYPALFEQAGIKAGDPIPVQFKSFDMSAQSAKIVQENPDIVAIAGLPEQASKVIKELRRQGYEGRIIGSQIFADPNVVELFGPEGDGTLLVAGFWKGRTDASAAFNEKFVAEAEKRGIHKLGAHHSDAQAYDILFLLKQAMEAADVTGDPARLDEERQAIVEAMDGIAFSGIIGDDICFQRHDAQLPGYIIEIKDGAWTKFDEVPADPCE